MHFKFIIDLFYCFRMNNVYTKIAVPLFKFYEKVKDAICSSPSLSSFSPPLSQPSDSMKTKKMLKDSINKMKEKADVLKHMMEVRLATSA